MQRATDCIIPATDPFVLYLNSARAYPAECYQESQVKHHEDAEDH